MSETTKANLRELCIEKGLRMTEQREVLVQVLEQADDHPDVEEMLARARAIDPSISMATVYRTVKLFEDAGILVRHDFKNNRGRFEEAPREHHDHLIDVRSGDVIEFQNSEMEALQEKIAAELGFKLTDHRLELYGVPLNDTAAEDEEKS